MKIGLIAPPWLPVPPPSYGGTEAVIDRLARGFAAEGHEVLLWATGDSACTAPTEWIFDEARPDDIGDMTIELEHVAAAYERMRDWGAEVIHDHTLSGPGFSGKHAGCPVVTTCHGPFDSVLGDLYRQLSGRVPIIAISHDQASRADGIRIVRVIHHGIDVDAVPVGDGRGDERGPFLLHVGRMSVDKGIPHAIEAARRSGQRLLIASKMREPLEHEYFRTCVEPMLGGDVEYIGEVGQGERDELMGRATALLNPIQWNEPFGLVMIEAMACGTPVIGLRRGSVAEVVDDDVTGFVCDDLDDVVDAIGAVGGIDREGVRRVASTRFSTERMVRQHVALFEDLVLDQRVA